MNNQHIVTLEEQLKAAMIDSDIPVLDELIADDLIFTNHLGQIMSKQDDLKAHRSGFVKIKSIEQAEQQIKQQNDIFIVSVLTRIQGKFGDEESDATLRFTRIWQKQDNGEWQATVVHSTLISEMCTSNT